MNFTLLDFVPPSDDPPCAEASWWEPGVSTPYLCALPEHHSQVRHAAFDETRMVFAVWDPGQLAFEL